MAVLLYDTGGTGSYTTLAAAITAATTAGDLIAVKNTSSEGSAYAANVIYTASATHTPANPLRLWCVSDFDADPTGLSSGAVIMNTTGSYSITFTGNWDLQGIDLRSYATAGSSAARVLLHSTSGSGIITLKNCIIGTNATNGSALSLVGLGGSSSADAYKTYLNDVTWIFSAITHTIFLGAGEHIFQNLILSGSVTPTTLFLPVGSSGYINTTVRNSDLTGKAWTNIVNAGTVSAQLGLRLENCKMPASFNWYIGTPTAWISIIAVNCGNSDVNYGYYELQGDSGTIITTPSIYATTNPITDGGVSISDAFTTFSTCGRGNPLSHSYEVVVANDTAVNPYVEVLVLGDNAAALKTTELYIEVEALATDGTTLGVKYTSRPGLLDPGTIDCAAGTTAYTGDSYTTERTHRLTVPTFTTRQAGRVRITVCLAKASSGIFVGDYGV